MFGDHFTERATDVNQAPRARPTSGGSDGALREQLRAWFGDAHDAVAGSAHRGIDAQDHLMNASLHREAALQDADGDGPRSVHAAFHLLKLLRRNSHDNWSSAIVANGSVRTMGDIVIVPWIKARIWRKRESRRWRRLVARYSSAC